MSWFKSKRINLDHAAGKNNPSAIYEEGVRAKKKLEEARTKISRILSVQSKDIIFTSGGTESDNLAMFGVFEAYKSTTSSKTKKPHFIISSLEHSAIFECAKEIQNRGGEVTIIEEDEEGRINPEQIKKAIKPNTVLVSIIYASNELGTIQPIHKISRLIHAYRKEHNSQYPYFHTDASQAGSYLSLDVSSLGVDMLTLDASKISDLKGTGLLMIRPNVSLRPIILGGGQERGLRAGTENVEAISKFAEALAKVQKNKKEESERLSVLRQYFVSELQAEIPKIIINGSNEETLPNIVSVSFLGVIAEFLALKLDLNGVMVSVGSSCRANKNELDRDAIRFSFGRETTKKDLKKTVRILKKLC